MTQEERIRKIFTIFNELERTTKTSKKIELLQQIKDFEEFKQIVKIVFSKNLKTYVSYKKLLTWPNGKKQIATFPEFLELVGLLSNRKITGNKASAEIQKFLLACDDFHAKWYRRILGKDLRANFGENLLQIIYGKNIIEFRLKPMLATASKGFPKLEEFVESRNWIYERKIDGLRCLTVFENGVITCYSRNGKRLLGAEKFLVHGVTEETLQKLNGMVIDGEFYSKHWNQTMTTVFTKDIEVAKYLKSIEYYVFDIVPLETFKKKVYNVPLLKRKQVLNQAFKYLKSPFKQITFEPLKDKDLKILYKIAEQYISQGFEGLVLKNINSPYVCKRSKEWLKFKQVKTIDLLCVGVEKSYKNPNEISALYIKYKGKTCKVGSGLSLEQRKRWYKNPQEIVGKIIEVEYQEESSDHCLRNPAFIRIRFDKDIPDA